MHIILGALGLIITILILFRRLSDAGIDIGWLDPFKAHRRYKWRKAYHANPLFDIDDPMKATACLMYTIAKCSGDISKEEKSYIISIFKETFKLPDKEATELLSNCSFYIKDENQVKDNLEKFMKASIENFADEQKEAAFSLIEKVAFCEGNPNEKQSELLAEIKAIFTPKKETFRKW